MPRPRLARSYSNRRADRRDNAGAGAGDRTKRPVGLELGGTKTPNKSRRRVEFHGMQRKVHLVMHFAGLQFNPPDPAALIGRPESPDAWRSPRRPSPPGK
jgi:hypothetical protein